MPDSNRLLAYRRLRGVGGGVDPYNDMQARLSRQYLGGPATPLEVLSRVAEGNHYQWGLAPGDFPTVVMPDEMAARIPRAAFLLGYYEALHEIGALLPEPAADPPAP